MRGFLVFDKPPGLTSHDIVGMLRAVSGVKRIGHTGTLDPFATGVLPIAAGAATRLIQYLAEDLKVYDATLALGTATDTGDLDGQVIAEREVPALDEGAILQALGGFLGERMQEPPRYSAVKVDGKPLYAYARAGQDVRAEARPIRIDAIDLLEARPDRLRVRVRCGKGTYIRVLGEEIAAALGTVGHLVALRRERSGPFSLDGALTASELARIVAGIDDWTVALRRHPERPPWAPRDAVRAALAPRLLSPLDALAHLPLVELGERDARRVRCGGSPPPPPPGAPAGGLYRLAYGGELVALAADGKLERVIPPAGDGDGDG